MNVQSQSISLTRVDKNSAAARNDQVAVEEPLEIRLGYQSGNARTSQAISVTMRTPGDDKALAVGFLVSESIIASADDILAVDYLGEEDADTGHHNVVRVDLAADVSVDLDRLQRNFYTTSSCGVCGKSSLDALRTVGAMPLPRGHFQISSNALSNLPAALQKTQQTFAKTGGLHAAALFDSNGDIHLSREDIGRHNAVDKVVGSCLLAGNLPCNAFGLMVSGRASFELVQKAIMAGFSVIAAVSAPSSLAIQLAEEFDLTLVGFLRGDTFNIYSAKERIT